MCSLGLKGPLHRTLNDRAVSIRGLDERVETPCLPECCVLRRREELEEFGGRISEDLGHVRTDGDTGKPGLHRRGEHRVEAE